MAGGRAPPDPEPLRRRVVNGHLLSVLAYVVATFATQAVSHFVLNTEHYAAVSYMRPDPIFPLGVLSMLIQGAILSHLYARIAGNRGSLWTAVGFSWLMGTFLVSYISLAEAAKYSVPSVGSWIGVEALAGLVQFSTFGVLLSAVHRYDAKAASRLRAA